MKDIIITTTNNVENYVVDNYLGVVTANLVIGTNVFSDFVASLSDFFGGMSGTYRKQMDTLYERARDQISFEAKQKGANAILGYRIDFDEISGQGKSMFMISVSGTAVKLSSKPQAVKKSYRYDIYQKLFNLKQFLDAGVITDEQYNTEKDNLLLSYEKDIQTELEAVKSDNTVKEAERRAEQMAKELRAKQLQEIDDLLAKQRVEDEKKRRDEEEDAANRRAKAESLQQIKDAFMAVAPEKHKIVKEMLNLNIANPEPLLKLLTLNDIKGAKYDSTMIDPDDKVAFVVGSFIKTNQIAEACKYYIDILNDDDITEAKSYVQSVYEIITFAKQSAFEKIALKLIELKYLGNNTQAVVDFMKYAICDKETAEKVLEFL